MEDFLFYLLKVAVLITVMFALYKLLLGNETFYRFNRIILLTMAMLSFILPLCDISKYIYRLDSVFMTDVIKTLTEVSDIDNLDGTSDKALVSTQVIVSDNTLNIANANTKTQAIPESLSSNSRKDILIRILMIVYCTVFILVLIKKTISVLSIAKVINKGRYANRLDGCDVIESDRINQPLNWMKYIVMPKDWLDKNNSAVWQHENFHARKWHSIDLLISDFMTAFQWFNPVMVLFHKELALIHEYEADRAVIDSGADVHEYKLMLVNAVASSRGFGMTSWLKQSNLKNRIDMMNRTKSNGCNKLKVLFIPLLAGLFLLVNSCMTLAKIKTFSYPVFEEGTIWIFKDGKAKVKTFDGVEANMNVDDTPNYLKKYKAFKTKRITLRYMYPIDGLEDVQPLAEKLATVGVKSSIATDDEILKNMTMPEYRCARIYDLGNGRYRFVMNGDGLEVVRDNRENKYRGLSITGDIELMKKWIGMFDGHGVAIYPKTMPYSDVEQMAQATWNRGINQVSIVDKQSNRITLVPSDRKLSKEFPGADAISVAKKLNDEISTNYFSKGTRIQNPKSFYNSNQIFFNITDIVRTDDELIIVYSSFQGPNLWLTGTVGMEILVDGKKYKQTKYEGLKGFEKEYFWSPDYGYYTQNIHFPAIPEDAKTIDLYDSEDNSLVVKGLQVSEDASSFDNIRTKRLSAKDRLKTVHIHEDMDDVIQVVRADFSDTETTIYVEMHIFEPHSFLGYVGSDFALTLGDGQILRPIRVDGVPVDEDFDRHGDHVTTYFQLRFPPISEEDWNASTPILKGTICHEPLTFRLEENNPEAIIFNSEAVKEMPKGDFKRCMAIILDENSITHIALKGISFDGKGSMTVSGDQVNLLLGDGTHTVSLGETVNNNSKFVIKSNGKELELLISKLSYKNPSGKEVIFGYVLKKMNGDKMEYQIRIQEIVNKNDF